MTNFMSEVNLFKYGVRAKSPHKKTQGRRLKPARETELAPTFLIRDLLHVWKISRLKIWRWIILPRPHFGWSPVEILRADSCKQSLHRMDGALAKGDRPPLNGNVKVLRGL